MKLDHDFGLNLNDGICISNIYISFINRDSNEKCFENVKQYEN